MKPPEGAPRRRILLVGDTAAVLALVQESFEDAGFEVDAVQTATEAVERLAARRYAAILSDCVLPDLPPLEWLAVARGAAPATPLVVYSGAVHLDGSLQSFPSVEKAPPRLSDERGMGKPMRHEVPRGSGRYPRLYPPSLWVTGDTGEPTAPPGRA